MYTPKKNEYQKGYENGKELVDAHINKDGKLKAKKYIQKLADKNKGKTDAMDNFLDNSATYIAQPQYLQEENTTNDRSMDRFNDLVDTLKYYWYLSDEKKLTDEQLAEYRSAAEEISEFGEIGERYAKAAFEDIKQMEYHREDAFETAKLEENKTKNYKRKMKRNRVRLTESQLHKLITESVKNVLQEGHWNSNVYSEFEELRETLGDDTLISELYNYMGGDDIEDFIEHIKRMYDLDNENITED